MLAAWKAEVERKMHTFGCVRSLVVLSEVVEEVVFDPRHPLVVLGVVLLLGPLHFVLARGVRVGGFVLRGLRYLLIVRVWLNKEECSVEQRVVCPGA